MKTVEKTCDMCGGEMLPVRDGWSVTVLNNSDGDLRTYDVRQGYIAVVMARLDDGAEGEPGW